MLTPTPVLGTLRNVDLRTVWPKEALDFTTWLGENLPALNTALGIDLELVQREALVGAFSCDVLARVVGTHDVVVIENQLEDTDHKHLGQLLTYAAGFDASYMIWISRDFREEHRAALDWLNNNTDSKRSFFGVLVEALQIDDSRPAVNFKIVASPNSWQKSAASTGREAQLSPDQEGLFSVFQSVYEIARSSGEFRRLLRPIAQYSFYVMERTNQHVEYCIAFGRGSIRAEVVLRFGSPIQNIILFNELTRRRDAIQSGVQAPIFWDFKESGRIMQALRVTKEIDRSRLEEQKDDLARWCTDRIIELRRAVEPGLSDEVKAAALVVEQDRD